MRDKYLSSRRPKWLPMAIIIIIAASMLLWWRFTGIEVYSQPVISWALAGKTIFVDPGHGASDPGVASPDGLLEKDVNLDIAQALSEILRQAGASVVLSRENDTLIDNTKKADLDRRLQMMTDTDSVVCISIHANSFPRKPSIYGAQVFFNKDDERGQILATDIQEEVSKVSNSNRKALAHPTAYILQHNAIPMALVEVGFFSNEVEKALLQDEEYQWQLAWAIYSGIVDYFVTLDNES